MSRRKHIPFLNPESILLKMPTLRKFPLSVKCFDTDHMMERGEGHKNHYKNRNNNDDPNGYPFGRCGGKKRKCQSIFSKLLDYTVMTSMSQRPGLKNKHQLPQQVANTTTEIILVLGSEERG